MDLPDGPSNDDPHHSPIVDFAFMEVLECIDWCWL